jgi:hypothetical protein
LFPVVVGRKSTSQVKGVRKKVGTYTPMTDCFFGGSALMIATGDQRIKDGGEM